MRLVALSRRVDYWVLRCTAPAWPTSFVLKLAGPGCGFPINFARTAAVSRLVRNAGIPVAEVLAFDDSYQFGPWRFLLQEYVEGQEWKHFRPSLSSDAVERSYAQLAGVLVALRGIGFDRFGDLGPDGRPTSNLEFLAALEQRANATVIDPRRRDAYVGLLHRESSLFSTDIKASLCHDDLHHQNLIFERGSSSGGIVAVLDWDKAWAGHHESDLARMALWDDMTHPALWSAYRDAYPLAEGEEERRPIYQLLWCLEYDVTTRRHQADTARLARQVGIDL